MVSGVIMKKSKSQIFLLLTILIITFLVGISSTLVDIRRSQYNDPIPGGTHFNQVWDGVIDNIHQTLKNSISRRSNGNITSVTEMQDFILGQFQDLSSFIASNGYSLLIELKTNLVEGSSYLAQSSATFESFALNSINVELILSSQQISLEQNLFIDIEYRMEKDTVSNQISLFSIVNNYRKASKAISWSDSIDLSVTGTGQYSYSGTGNYLVINSDGIYFSQLAV